MYNVSICYYHDNIQKVRFYSQDVKKYERKKPKYHNVPFIDSDPESPDFNKPLRGREVDRLPGIDYDSKAESIRCSLSRTKKMVKHISLSFKCEYFATFTFSSEYCDRYSYDEVSSLMQTFLHSLPSGVQYIVIPELHKDGAFHFHGLFSGIPLEYAGRHRVGKRISDVWHCPLFTYGFQSFLAARSSKACSFYIMKYITKSLCAVSKGKKRYWYSRSSIVLAPEIKVHLQPEDYLFLKDLLSKEGNFYECTKSYIQFSEIYSTSLSLIDVLSLADIVHTDDCSFYISS